MCVLLSVNLEIGGLSEAYGGTPLLKGKQLAYGRGQELSLASLASRDVLPITRKEEGCYHLYTCIPYVNENQILNHWNAEADFACNTG